MPTKVYSDQITPHTGDDRIRHKAMGGDLLLQPCHPGLPHEPKPFFWPRGELGDLVSAVDGDEEKGDLGTVETNNHFIEIQKMG